MLADVLLIVSGVVGIAYVLWVCIYSLVLNDVIKEVMNIKAVKEPVDWTKVEQGTKVFTWNNCFMPQKEKGYFAMFENGRVFTYQGGQTPWSNKFDSFISWDNAELAKVEEV